MHRSQLLLLRPAETNVWPKLHVIRQNISGGLILFQGSSRSPASDNPTHASKHSMLGGGNFRTWTLIKWRYFNVHRLKRTLEVERCTEYNFIMSYISIWVVVNFTCIKVFKVMPFLPPSCILRWRVHESYSQHGGTQSSRGSVSIHSRHCKLSFSSELWQNQRWSFQFRRWIIRKLSKNFPFFFSFHFPHHISLYLSFLFNKPRSINDRLSHQIISSYILKL